jgi:hypothetical protein
MLLPRSYDAAGSKCRGTQQRAKDQQARTVVEGMAASREVGAHFFEVFFPPGDSSCRFLRSLPVGAGIWSRKSFGMVTTASHSPLPSGDRATTAVPAPCHITASKACMACLLASACPWQLFLAGIMWCLLTHRSLTVLLDPWTWTPQPCMSGGEDIEHGVGLCE